MQEMYVAGKPELNQSLEHLAAEQFSGTREFSTNFSALE